MPRTSPAPFDVVRRIGLTLPGVASTTRDDGAPVLQVDGVFQAGLATHESAEPDTLVVRADPEAREACLADAPGTYYLTEYYRRYPLILVRLSQVTPDAVHDLLRSSYRLTLPKTRLGRTSRRPRS